jgi:hypothetical protein
MTQTKTKAPNHESRFREIKFTDADVINLDDYIPAGEYNPHNVRPFLLHDHGFVLCVVFASNLQDALDEAADKGKLDRYSVSWEEAGELVDSNADGFCFLGNASEPFDIESLGVEELPNPPRLFCALFNAMG